MAASFAVFVASSWDYIQFTNALLNSIDRHQIPADVYLLHDFPPNNYLRDAGQRLSRFHAVPVERAHFRFDASKGLAVSDSLFRKQSRFRYVREIGARYEAVALLDADMFLVTRNFNNLFELVAGTSKLVGCNERFKWVFDRSYEFGDRPIFDLPVRATKFHCSVPIVLDAKRWGDVFDYYNQIAFAAYQVAPRFPGGIKWMGDIESWNIAVYKCGRADDVVLFPMETMTQVHGTNALPRSRIRKTREGWFSDAGDEVFTIHGRVGTDQWEQDQFDKLNKFVRDYDVADSERLTKDLRAVLADIKVEWNELNFGHKLLLSDYTPHRKIPVHRE